MRDGFLIVIPAYNEAMTIGSVVTECLQHCERVIVINDASTDATSRVAESAGASVVNLEGRGGNSRALIAGLDYALRQDYTNVVTLDADGAHDPHEIPHLMKVHIEQQSILTVGNRFAGDVFTEIPSVKLWSNYFASRVFQKILGVPLDDVACGFRAINNILLQDIIAYNNSTGYSIAYDMIALSVRNKYSIASCPVSVRYNAADLMYTRRIEIVNLLTSLLNFNYNHVINNLRNEVKQLNPLTIIINKKNICAHPIIHHDGYLFQIQNSVFIDRRIGLVFNLDML